MVCLGGIKVPQNIWGGDINEIGKPLERLIRRENTNQQYQRWKKTHCHKPPIYLKKKWKGYWRIWGENHMQEPEFHFSTQGHKQYYKQLHLNKIGTLDEMDKTDHPPHKKEKKFKKILLWKDRSRLGIHL